MGWGRRAVVSAGLGGVSGGQAEVERVELGGGRCMLCLQLRTEVPLAGAISGAPWRAGW